jgi:hypothetical protein
LTQLKDELNLDPALVERYIELLCEFRPEKVYPFVTSSEGYRLDNAMQVNYALICNFLSGLTFSIVLISFAVVGKAELFVTNSSVKN